MARHTYIYKRMRNIMSRHITNSKKDISFLLNLNTNLKKKHERRKEKVNKAIVVVRLVSSINEPCDIRESSQRMNMLRLKLYRQGET